MPTPSSDTIRRESRKQNGSAKLVVKALTLHFRISTEQQKAASLHATPATLQPASTVIVQSTLERPVRSTSSA
ncbi:uncharacterized protein RHO25_007963 [Cercospora beticola]|uniref:Uncharacterized protein n=1 Tax=Cercospora beticola TaxID=122368 RepID=A0ABZ0NV26_CERBT|nr:hypothetical protein RHO25_007963 [Cercospora beticola]